MKFTTTVLVLLAFTAGNVNAECDEKKDDVCIAEGTACLGRENECCGELECFGFPFFKKCQEVPECIDEWQDCDNGIECCGSTRVCALTDLGKKVCMTEEVGTRTTTTGINTGVTPTNMNTRTTKIPGEEVKFNYACATGDPHITSFDGLKWDCQGHGEHVILKSPETQRQVQGRFVQMDTHKYSVIKGLVIQDEGNTPRVQITMPEISQVEGGGVSHLLGDIENNCRVQFFVDGIQRDLYQGSGSDKVEVTVDEGNTITVKYTESEFEITVGMGYWNGCLMNSCYAIPDTDPVVSIFGTPDGDPFNDWIKPDGSSVAVPESLYDLKEKVAFDFCRNWCIRDENDSLFTYNQLGVDFEDFEFCDLPFNTWLVDHIEDNVTPDIEELCGEDFDCTVDAVTGGIEAARESKNARSSMLQHTCNKEGGECDAAKCCDGFTCTTLGGLAGKTCHANPAEPSCYPEVAECSDTKPCCEGLICEQRNNDKSFCKRGPSTCLDERWTCARTSECCGDMKCVGPDDNKRCVIMTTVDTTVYLPDGETCSYENQKFQCLPESKCILTTDGNRCTHLPQCWNTPWRPCGDNFGFPDCCQDSGNRCEWSNGRQLCVPKPQCAKNLFGCEDDGCCEGLRCDWRLGGQKKMCVEDPPEGCVNSAEGSAVDTGCVDSMPICFKSTGEMPETSEKGQFCGVCVNDKAEDGQDTGCPNEEFPRCVAGDGTNVGNGKVGHKCMQPEDEICINNSWSLPNTNCDAENPVCMKINNYRPDLHEKGSHCGRCINSELGDKIDAGCSSATPRCVASDGSEVIQWLGGGKCVEPLVKRCKNTNYGKGDGDENCNHETPVCAKQNGWQPDKDQTGDYCAVCKNTETSVDNVDVGCTEDAKNCVAANGSELKQWQIGTKCVTFKAPCKNTSWGHNDENCPASAPVCTKDNGWGAAKGKTGTKCTVCKNSQDSDSKKDIGCTDEKKRCVAANGSSIRKWFTGAKCI